MKLSDTDKRELCPQHGWVGRRAFQIDRHDLCEASVDEELRSDQTSSDNSPSAPAKNVEQAPLEGAAAETLDALTLPLSDASENRDAAPNAQQTVVPESVTAAPQRRRKNPPKKTLAVRRITQSALAAGRAELRALGGDHPYDRPSVRGDCRWCPVCQLVRDGKSDGLDSAALQELTRIGVTPPDVDFQPRSSSAVRRFACGHSATKILFRSRPCVFIACKHALYLDVSESGSIILNFPYLEPGQLAADRSCALDLADRGVMTLEDIASVTNLTRERIRQVELVALRKHARTAAVSLGLGPEDAAAAGTRHQVSPGADLEETGIEGGVPSDVASILSGGGIRET